MTDAGMTTAWSHGVRVLTAGDVTSGRHVVLVPGLGALAYLLPTVRRLALTGWRCTLLDLPGFGSRDRWASEPTVPAIAEAVAR